MWRAKDGSGLFVFAAETCTACPVRPQCTRSQTGRMVQLNPHEALLQQARALQRSPAFTEARRRCQVVEHRIARLVQLGIRQARYVGRTKTLFQVCLAAAVANLTLLVATSDASTNEHLHAGSVPVAFGTILSLIFSLVSVLAISRNSTVVYLLTRPVFALIRPPQAGSRPAF